MYFDRFDICEAWFVVEMYYHEGGWLHERPSNRRRRESCSVQMARIGFNACASLDYETLSENGREIFHDIVERLGLPAWDAA